MFRDHSIYFAPMEGVTTKVFRDVHRRFYSGIDKYFSPFIVVTSNLSFKKRDIKGVVPLEEKLVPQLLANDPKAFVWAARFLAQAGYKEVNLNAGCPSSTVTSKGKGSGLLENKDVFRRFLDDVFCEKDLPNISIKLRAGYYSTEEAPVIADIIAEYPFSEVIIHPRSREDFYNGKCDMDAFNVMAEKQQCPICYNGDIKSPEDMSVLHDSCLNQLSDLSRTDTVSVMIGRGLIASPGLADEIRFGKKDSDITTMKSFMNCLKDAYSAELSGERDVLFKLKEIWGYIGPTLSGFDKELKAVKKSKTISEYDLVTDRIFDDLL